MTQLSFFDEANAELAQMAARIAGFMKAICAAMNAAAASSRYSRQEIVSRMNKISRAAGVRLTQGKAEKIDITTLEKWLNPNSDNNPSMLAVEVFMLALGDVSPLSTWLTLHNCQLMTPQAKMYHDLGKLKMTKKEAAEQERLLELLLKKGGMQ